MMAEWVLFWDGLSTTRFLESWGDETVYTNDISKAKVFSSLEEAMAFLLRKTYYAGKASGVWNSGLMLAKRVRVDEPSYKLETL